MGDIDECFIEYADDVGYFLGSILVTGKPTCELYAPPANLLNRAPKLGVFVLQFDDVAIRFA